MTDLFADLGAEIQRQDAKHGSLNHCEYDLARLRLALAVLEDEIAEALVAYRDERSANGWPETRAEVLQIAAVAMRILRDCVEDE